MVIAAMHDQDEHRREQAPASGMLADPGVVQRRGAAQLDRQRTRRIPPEERIEDARAAREQLAGVERMALLRQPLAQLPDSDGEHAVLLQRAVELAEVSP